MDRSIALLAFCCALALIGTGNTAEGRILHQATASGDPMPATPSNPPFEDAIWSLAYRFAVLGMMAPM
ncbi:hypothetical protein WJX73_003273 [Symbiochloris irregularis]|uniref:Uncharacterized protein n=1 Tax=Symbiochloris irregularis TaxID=706552 RepID=A0AAW1NU27_9CHLO